MNTIVDFAAQHPECVFFVGLFLYVIICRICDCIEDRQH